MCIPITGEGGDKSHGCRSITHQALAITCVEEALCITGKTEEKKDDRRILHPGWTNDEQIDRVIRAPLHLIEISDKILIRLVSAKERGSSDEIAAGKAQRGEVLLRPFDL